MMYVYGFLLAGAVASILVAAKFFWDVKRVSSGFRWRASVFCVSDEQEGFYEHSSGWAKSEDDARVDCEKWIESVKNVQVVLNDSVFGKPKE